MGRGTRRDDLGMSCRITRRDFLNGVALGVVGASVPALRGREARAAGSPPAAAPYPPSRTGLRGAHPGSIETLLRLRDGSVGAVAVDEQTGESYDLVVVGAGLSGLAAAWFHQQAHGGRRVLVLDNHDDFGGHAKRNEFESGGRRFATYGGSENVVSTSRWPWSDVARGLLRDLRVDVDRYRAFLEDVYAGRGLLRSMFFDRETFGEDRLVRGMGSLAWDEVLAQSPLPPPARRDLVRLHTETKDYLPVLGPEEKRARLARMSYEAFLRDVARVHPLGIEVFRARLFTNAMRVDTIPALTAAEEGAPGFGGMGILPLPPGPPFVFHFPDGNAALARLLIARLVPAAVGGPQDMTSITEARLDYDRLDQPDAPVRVRLGSTAVRCTPAAAAVDVAYVRGGRTYGVRARACVLACDHTVIPQLVPELPAEQKAALAARGRVPMLLTNVFLRSWRAFAKLRVASIDAPGLYHSFTELEAPISIGGYRCSRQPEEPVVVHMQRGPSYPGLPRREQLRRGTADLLATPFDDIEQQVRRQLARMLGEGGFDPAADILAITANRWPSGFAYAYDTLSDPDVPDDQRPHVLARRPFGAIAIANVDAGGAQYAQVAIDQAHRAVQDVARATARS